MSFFSTSSYQLPSSPDDERPEWAEPPLGVLPAISTEPAVLFDTDALFVVDQFLVYPNGNLTFVSEWPAHDVPETSVSVDATSLRERASEAVTLWPDSPWIDRRRSHPCREAPPLTTRGTAMRSDQADAATPSSSRSVARSAIGSRA